MKNASPQYEAARKTGKRPHWAPQEVKRGNKFAENAELSPESSYRHATNLVFAGVQLLDFSPIEALHAIAPHFFGSSQGEADMRLELVMRVLALPAKSAEPLLKLVEKLPLCDPVDAVRKPAKSKPERQ